MKIFRTIVNNIGRVLSSLFMAVMLFGVVSTEAVSVTTMQQASITDGWYMIYPAGVPNKAITGMGISQLIFKDYVETVNQKSDQKWYVKKVSTGIYTIQNEVTGNVWTVGAGTVTNNRIIGTSAVNNTSNQKFKFWSNGSRNYVISSVLSSDFVVDYPGQANTGVGIQLFGYHGCNNQLFGFKAVNPYIPPQPVLKKEVAERYVDVYNDANLTSKKSGSFISKGETYCVVSENAKSLQVKYKSDNGADREGYVGVEVRKKDVKLNAHPIWGNKLPLLTYAYKKINSTPTYGTNVSTSYYIDSWEDLVTVKTVYEDGWALGSYPNTTGKLVERWFKFNDLLPNPNYTWSSATTKRSGNVFRVFDRTGNIVDNLPANTNVHKVGYDSKYGKYQIVFQYEGRWLMGWVFSDIFQPLIQKVAQRYVDVYNDYYLTKKTGDYLNRGEKYWLVTEMAVHLGNSTDVSRCLQIKYKDRNGNEKQGYVSIDINKELQLTLLGDVNSDGKVDLADETALSSYLVGKSVTNFNSKNADMSGNGIVDGTDLVKLTQRLTGTNIKGDVNNDGKVTKEDLDILEKYIVGTLKTLGSVKNADLNKDGQISITDVTLLTKIVANVSPFAGFTEVNIANGWYKITSLLGDNLAITSDGKTMNSKSILKQYSENLPYKSNQKWYLQKENGGYYLVHYSGYVWNVGNNGRVADGTPLILGTGDRENKQFFRLYKNSAGVYIIKPVDGTHHVVDVYGSYTADGTAVQLFTYHGNKNQLWKITAATQGTTDEPELKKGQAPCGLYYPLGYRANAKNNTGEVVPHDYMANKGTPVYAIEDGVVHAHQTLAKRNGRDTLISYGNVIYFEGKRYAAVYAHLDKFVGLSMTDAEYAKYVIPSSQTERISSTGLSSWRYPDADGWTRNVKAGDIIGYVGSTGNSSGPHLHFELYDNVNSMFISGRFIGQRNDRRENINEYFDR